ncbi:pro-sigmaK processing inhibitor BofA family protein [Paenibacillus sp. JSM ZJ436]|uniref:pro-sigmaK processing inhibitor BofA family protein n=1 Tax=Paenibacillus sp. JSM ZJ436 TaxID=3376190 RepID=UPI0037B042BD
MKLIIAAVMVLSLTALLFIIFRKKLGFQWLTLFGTHLVLSALGVYVINFSGLISEVYIPLNPMTVGTVMMLGLPGVALLVALKLIVI